MYKYMQSNLSNQPTLITVSEQAANRTICKLYANKFNISIGFDFIFDAYVRLLSSDYDIFRFDYYNFFQIIFCNGLLW